jgi:hypothetical protein
MAPRAPRVTSTGKCVSLRRLITGDGENYKSMAERKKFRSRRNSQIAK